MKKLSLSIKAKLFLLRLGLGIVLALVVGMSSYFIARNTFQEKILESLAFDARISSNRLQYFFERKVADIMSIATHPIFAKYSTSGRESLLLVLFNEYKGGFSSLSFVDADGDEVVKVTGGETFQNLSNISESPYYARALKHPNTVVISDFVPSETAGRKVVGLYMNVTDYFDEPLGFLYATLSEDEFKGVLEGAILNSGGIVALLDDSGTIVTGIYNDGRGKDLFGSIRNRSDFKTLNAESLDLRDPSRAVDFLGRSWHLVFARADIVDYKVVIWASHDQLYGGIVKLRNSIFMIAFVFVLGAELFARMLGLKITEPIEKLNRLAAEIAESGSMTERVDWQSRDELGQLAHSFNKMLDKLETVMVQLEKEQMFSQGVLTSMADMLTVVTPRGSIVTVNTSLCRILDYNAGELIGTPVKKLFAGHDFSVDEEQLFDPEGRGIPFRVDLEYQTRSGDPVAVEFVRSTLLDHDGTVFGVVFVAKDVRSDRALEEERRRNEERVKQVKEELFRTEKMALVGQMSGMVAHEVLNPISAINVRIALNLKNSGELKQVVGVLKKVIGDWVSENESNTFSAYFSEKGSQDLVLLEKIADMLERKQEERQEDLQFIEKLIARVIKTIDGFREMSRQRETIEDVSLVRVTQEILEDMQDGIHKRNVQVSVDCRDEVVIRADFMEIYSIISNILRNGLQAIDKRRDQARRTIHISIERLAADMVKMLISDSGAGMDAYTRQHVFEPDFTSKGRKGTGIGMSFSRKIARKYGGDIRVLQSEVNAGTTFEIVLQGVKKQDDE